MIIHDCEQRSPEWYALRAGIPTASCFDRLVTSSGAPSKQIETYALTLAAEKYAGQAIDAWEGNQWTQRGRELEPEALQIYRFITGNDLQAVGFVTADDGRSGCSPDSLVGDDGLIEVKCLKAENHIRALSYIARNRKAPPGYEQQLQGQMMVCERFWCDIIFYHPILPHSIIRYEADTTFMDKLHEGIGEVCEARDDAYAFIMQFAGEETSDEVAAKVARTVAAAAPTDLSNEPPVF